MAGSATTVGVTPTGHLKEYRFEVLKHWLNFSDLKVGANQQCALCLLRVLVMAVLLWEAAAAVTACSLKPPDLFLWLIAPLAALSLTPVNFALLLLRRWLCWVLLSVFTVS